MDPKKMIVVGLATALAWDTTQKHDGNLHTHHEREKGPPIHGKVAAPSANVAITAATFTDKGPITIDRV